MSTNRSEFYILKLHLADFLAGEGIVGDVDKVVDLRRVHLFKLQNCLELFLEEKLAFKRNVQAWESSEFKSGRSEIQYAGKIRTQILALKKNSYENLLPRSMKRGWGKTHIPSAGCPTTGDVKKRVFLDGAHHKEA